MTSGALTALQRDRANRIANCPAIVRRAHVLMLGEYSGEYRIWRIANIKGDLCDRNIRQFEKFAGFLHSQSGQIDPWRHTDTLLEHAGEMKR